jgi:hypothetical protein
MIGTPQVISIAMQLNFIGNIFRNINKFFRLEGVF